MKTNHYHFMNYTSLSRLNLFRMMAKLSGNQTDLN